MRPFHSIRIVGVLLGTALGFAVFACDSENGGYLPCDSPSPLLVAGKETGFVQCSGGSLHRTLATTCPNVISATGGTCPIAADAGPTANGCKDNGDCTEHPYGMCNAPYGDVPQIACSCSYGCVQDSDCGKGYVCLCQDPVGFCVQSSCTTDKDCAAGALCTTSTPAVGSCDDYDFVCQSTADSCLSDTDCKGSASGNVCSLQESGGVMARSCVMESCVIGRPFIVDEVVRVAAVTARQDWQNGSFIASPVTLDDAHRAALAEHWTRVGQMEHASIASFARFAMDLLALGAPADLLVQTSKAMADETEHARMAFALASTYANNPIGPACLDVSGALRPSDARHVFATLVREGCIGETLAAVEATEAYAHATDSAVKKALEKIAADETSHAELSFRAAHWMFAQGDGAFRAWAEAEFTNAVSERRASRASGQAVSCPEHGLLSSDVTDTLWTQALTSLVLPCWNAITTERARTKLATASSLTA